MNPISVLPISNISVCADRENEKTRFEIHLHESQNMKFINMNHKI